MPDPIMKTAPLPAPALPTATPPAPVPSAPIEPATPPVDAAAPAPAPEVAPKPEKPKPATPFSWKDDFSAIDKDKDGKLGKSELKLGKAKGTDLNKDGQVDYREFREAKVKANSFEGLDKNKDGQLDTGELAKMRRFDDRQYGDGQTVSKADFNKTRQAELFDNRTAKMKARFKEGLTPEQKQKFERFAGKDGKLSADEYVTGRRQAWREWHAGRQAKLFERAGGENGTLDVTSKAGARYKGYDADNDGKVSMKEFNKGYKADLKDVWASRIEKGGLTDPALRARMGYGKDGFADVIEMPKGMGDKFKSREDWFICQYGGESNTREDVTGWDNANCGPTSLTMVARAFGKIDPDPSEVDAAIEKSRRMMGDAQSERDGTSAAGIARGAEAYGLDAKVEPRASLKSIEAELKKGRLPIINGNVIRPDGSYGGGHFYVVTKIENGKAYLNDPYSRTGPSVVSTDRLMHSINTHFAGNMISVGDK